MEGYTSPLGFTFLIYVFIELHEVFDAVEPEVGHEVGRLRSWQQEGG